MQDQLQVQKQDLANIDNAKRYVQSLDIRAYKIQYLMSSDGTRIYLNRKIQDRYVVELALMLFEIKKPCKSFI